MNAAEVAEELDTSRQTVDRHLRNMETEGLAKSRKVGTVRVWWVSDEGKAYLHKTDWRAIHATR